MENWKTIKLKDVCQRITVGHVGSMAGEYKDSGIPFLRSLNITPFRLSRRELKFIDKKFHERLRKSELKPGDVAVVRTGYPGTACVIPKELGEANCSDLVLITPGSELNPYFLAAIFNSAFGKDLVGGRLVGAAQQHFNITTAKELKLRLPPKDDQDKIAAILTAYDDLIEVNKRRIALLEKMAEELYREWFVRMRFPGHQNARFVKGVPEEWKDTQLGKIAKFTMGQSPKSEFYNENGEGLPFHQGVGTYGERFPNTVTYCSVDGRRASKGDILFSVRAPVGRLNIAGEEMIIGRGLAAINHNQGKSVYLYYLLKNTFSREDIIGNGAIFNSVGKDELSRFSVYGHPEELIDQYEEVAGPIDRQIENLIRSTKNLTQTRDLLLPRLISGKLPVEDLDIQFPPSMQEGASH